MQGRTPWPGPERGGQRMAAAPVALHYMSEKKGVSGFGKNLTNVYVIEIKIFS
jgi:hypothetical protein